MNDIYGHMVTILLILYGFYDNYELRKINKRLNEENAKLILRDIRCRCRE